MSLAPQHPGHYPGHYANHPPTNATIMNCMSCLREAYDNLQMGGAGHGILPAMGQRRHGVACISPDPGVNYMSI